MYDFYEVTNAIHSLEERIESLSSELNTLKGTKGDSEVTLFNSPIREPYILGAVVKSGDDLYVNTSTSSLTKNWVNARSGLAYEWEELFDPEPVINCELTISSAQPRIGSTIETNLYGETTFYKREEFGWAVFTPSKKLLKWEKVITNPADEIILAREAI